ncbi:hypothetical protein Tco_0184343 [Tanacetum coccineum]
MKNTLGRPYEPGSNSCGHVIDSRVLDQNELNMMPTSLVWKLALMDYIVNLYHPGKANVVADALSRRNGTTKGSGALVLTIGLDL